VSDPFVPTHDYTSYTNGIEFNLLKNPYRARLNYTRITLDTSGGGYDSSTTTDTVGFNGTHTYRDISTTNLSGSWFNTNSTTRNLGQSSNGNGYQISASNNVAFDRQRRYTLMSVFLLQDQTIGTLPQKNLNLNETFVAQLGKALELDASYNYSYNSITSFQGVSQTFSSNAVRVSLVHHLYSSLTTHLYGRGSWSELLGGTENVFAGGAILTYNKRLSRTSLLTVEVSGEHEETDRSVKGSELTVTYEKKLVKLQGDFIFLTNDIQTGSVRVFSYKPPTPPPPVDAEYQEYRDYTVDYLRGGIWITTAGHIRDNSTIYVSYVARITPSLKYSTDTRSLSSSLSFFDGKYLLSGVLYAQNQNPISGQTRFAGLRDTYIKQLTLRGNHHEHSYTLQYYDYSSGNTKYHFFQGFWLYWHQFPFGNLQLQARERYSVYDSVGFQGSYGENTLTGSVSYGHPVTPWSQIQLSLIAVDTRWGPQGTTDYLYFRLNYQARFNRLTLSLTGSTGWRFYGNTTLRDDFVRLELVRYF